MERTREEDWNSWKKIVKKWGLEDEFFENWFEEREAHISTGHENYVKQKSLSQCKCPLMQYSQVLILVPFFAV